MQPKPIAPTRRTTPSKRSRRAAGAALAAALVVATAACSSDDAKPARQSTTTTISPVATTAPVPLAKGAEQYELAYLSDDGKQTTVFLTHGDGSKTDVITRVKGRAEALTWSPDGTKLLFDGDATGDFDLQVLDVATKKTTPLAGSASSNEGGASWSPDGSQVAFFSNRDGSFAGYVVDAGGGEPKRITPQEAPNVGDLRWSPDGTTIAFSTSSGVDSDVWLVGADGSSPRKVSTQAGSNQPAWSPDGTSLAIAAQPVGEPDPGIYQLDPKTGATKLLADTKYRDSFPVWSWSPEGKFLYFVSAVPNDDADGGDADDLYRVASRGGKPEGVITDPISIESELQPTADGRLIVFSVARLRDKEVFVANADGSGAIPVSRSDRKDSFGAWRPGTGPDQR